MARLCCTQKLLNFLRVKVDDSVGVTKGGPLGNWYANLIWVERKRCILFTNEETLFSFFVPDVKKEHLKDLRAFFRGNLQKGLVAVGIPRAMIARLLLKLDKVSVAKTANRSVLGSMNDYAFQYKHHILCEGRIGHCDIANITRRVNETPMSALGWESGTRTLIKHLEQYVT